MKAVNKDCYSNRHLIDIERPNLLKEPVRSTLFPPYGHTNRVRICTAPSATGVSREESGPDENISLDPFNKLLTVNKLRRTLS